MSSTVLRTSFSRSIQALVVTSPATITTPVLTRVSQATRPAGSSRRIASSTASEIWSAILSGWPSETDSDVNKYWLDIERIQAAKGLVGSITEGLAMPRGRRDSLHECVRFETLAAI